jgi:hypothetical protein
MPVIELNVICSLIGEKQFHASINRLGRAVDSVFDPAPSRISFQTNLPKNLVSQWILEHILRQGNVQIAETFAKARFHYFELPVQLISFPSL